MPINEKQSILDKALEIDAFRSLLIEVATTLLYVSSTDDDAAMVIQLVGTRAAYTDFIGEEMGALNKVVAAHREKYKHEIVKLDGVTGKREPAPDLPSI